VRDKGKILSRRDFIKGTLWTVGLVAVIASPLYTALRRVKASGKPSPMASVEEKVRAWSMVIDLKKCDGCVGLGIPPQCTEACVSGHLVPKGQKWIEVYTQELPGGGTYFMPTPCYQCENAPCVNVCPVGATYHDKNGIVLIDHRRCIGCRLCMAACPYQRRFFNWGTPELPPEAGSAKYSPIFPVPAVKGTVIKCIFCADLLYTGRLTRCVMACPRKALYLGDLKKDVASNGKEVVKLAKFLGENNAFRYKEHLGTKPRVWYLPGYGQEFGRKPNDPRPLYPTVWSWGGEGYNHQYGILPWAEEAK